MEQTKGVQNVEEIFSLIDDGTLPMFAKSHVGSIDIVPTLYKKLFKRATCRLARNNT